MVRPRTPITLAVAATLALTGPACSGSDAPAPSSSPAPSVTPLTPGVIAPPSGPTITVTLSDFQFDPFRVLMTSSQGLILTNSSGATLHNFSVPGQGVDVDIPAGQTMTLDPISDSVQPGTYPYLCKYHNAQGMIGVITVQAPTP
jgi:hypothetical protein